MFHVTHNKLHLVISSEDTHSRYAFTHIAISENIKQQSIHQIDR